MQKFNAGYELTDHISIDGQHYVLGRSTTSLGAQYVTWATNPEMDYFVYGHYFTDRDAATKDLLKRATETLRLDGQSVGMALLSDTDREKIVAEYREECALGDIESNLQDVIDRDGSRYDPAALMQDGTFLAKAKHAYDNIDHSYENEALADLIRDILEEHDFSHCKEQEPFHLESALRISPEMADLLDDLLSMPSASIPEKYGPLGDNFRFEFQFEGGMTASLELTPAYDDEQLSETRNPFVSLSVLDSSGEKILAEVLTADELDRGFTCELGIALGNGTLSLSLEADESLRRLGNQFVYQAYSEDERYTSHNGEVCKILRALTPEECDTLITGLMWEAEFPNGDVMHIFDEELASPISSREIKPSLDSRIKFAESKTTAPTAQNQDQHKDR